MPSRAEIDRVNGLVTAASASMEARFTDMGLRLGTAVDTIGTLTQTFDRLGNELDGENLRQATQQLSHIKSRVAAVGNLYDDRETLFGQLSELIAGIQQRMVPMGKAVASISMLAINTRIEAANIGDAGLDFVGFTQEIGRTLRLAEASLYQFTGELSGVGTHLRMAATSQRTLAQHRSEAVRTVPIRLEASIGAITDRGERVIAAASAVTKTSRQVGQRISDAVMALQVGDITRQRLEHIEYGLGTMAAILSPSDDAERSNWAELTDRQRDALLSLCGTLLSAQLLDAAEEFDREVRRILSAIQELATDAEDIMRVGNATAGATGDHRGTFLGKVEEQVAEVSALLEGATAARRDADAVVVSVSQATGRLVGHTTTLRSLEEDIRIMALNMTLKCGRLGAVGLPLMVIAQELRAYSSHIATESGAVTVRLDRMMGIAASLSDGRQDESTDASADVTAIMADTVSRLRAAGESLADALTSLAHDTETVGSLLRDTVPRATVQEELTTALRQAASDLTSTTACSWARDLIASPEADRMLDLILHSYTMERERSVHDREFPGRAGKTAHVAPPPANSAAAAAELEDVFF
jgi:hypothetical protein